MCRPEVLVSLTADVGKIIQSVYNAKVYGSSNLLSGLNVAQLVLKHRQNLNQAQRIIVFVGSPIETDIQPLVNIAKLLKRNEVAVDVVNFGEHDVNTEKLEAFINAVNKNDNSHLITVPQGPHILSDILLTSPLIHGGEAGGANAADLSAFGGVDPNLDPELALVLRVSLEEERARQEKKAAEEAGKETTPASSEIAQTLGDSASAHNLPYEVDMGELGDPEFAAAIALSLQEIAAAAASQAQQEKEAAPASAPQQAAPSGEDVEMEELDDEMAMAMQLSMGGQEKKSEGEGENSMIDPDFLQSVLLSLPGVDPNDINIQSVLESFKSDNNDEKKDK